MEITKRDGYYELSDVGYYLEQRLIDNVLAKYNNKPIVASLTTNQYRAIDFLIDNGFRKVGGIRVNPNSGNMICLYIRLPKNKLRKRSK